MSAAPVDQVPRRAAFVAEHEGASITGHPGDWHGVMPVSGKPREAWNAELGLLLNALDRLAAMDAIEREFGDWHVWVSGIGRWWATRVGRDYGHGDERPMTLDADDADGLRGALQEAEAAARAAS